MQEGLFTYGFIEDMCRYQGVTELYKMRMVNKRVKRIADRQLFYALLTEDDRDSDHNAIARQFMREISLADMSRMVSERACHIAGQGLLDRQTTLIRTAPDCFIFFQAQYPQYADIFIEFALRFRTLIVLSNYVSPIYQPIDLSPITEDHLRLGLSQVDHYYQRLNDVYYHGLCIYNGYRMTKVVDSVMNHRWAVHWLFKVFSGQHDYAERPYQDVIMMVISCSKFIFSYQNYYGRLTWVATPELERLLDLVLSQSDVMAWTIKVNAPWGPHTQANMGVLCNNIMGPIQQSCRLIKDKMFSKKKRKR